MLTNMDLCLSHASDGNFFSITTNGMLIIYTIMQKAMEEKILFKPARKNVDPIRN